MPQWRDFLGAETDYDWVCDAVGVQAVYPPAVVAGSPGRHVQWAPPDYSVLVFTPEGELVAHVGIVVRMGTLDEAAVTMGGVGSVKTHPRARAAAMRPLACAAPPPSCVVCADWF